MSNNHEYLFFKDELPRDIVEKLPEGTLEQYHLWDKICKKLLRTHPRLIVPAVKEVFGRIYNNPPAIRFLSNEYVVRKTGKGETFVLKSILSDITISIDGETFHLECQLEPDKQMMIRMLEYDFSSTIAHGIVFNEDGEPTDANMPQSVVFQLSGGKDKPQLSTKTIKLHMATGVTVDYEIKILNVQSYELSDVKKKELFFILPFMPIRFKNRLKYRKEHPDSKAAKDTAKALTDFMVDSMMNINDAKGSLSKLESKSIFESLLLGCTQLLKDDHELYKEVYHMLPEIEFSWEVRQELEPIIEKLKSDCDSMSQELNSVTAERDSIALKYDSIASERDSIASERDSIASERDIYRQKLVAAGIDPDA